MNLGSLEVRLTADWKDLLKKSSVWITSALGAFWMIAPEIANQWPQLSPFILSFAPATMREALGPFIGSVLILLAKFSYIRIGKGKANDGTNS